MEEREQQRERERERETKGREREREKQKEERERKRKIEGEGEIVREGDKQKRIRKWACRGGCVNPIYGCTCQLVMGRFVFRALHFNEIIPQFYRLKKIQKTISNSYLTMKKRKFALVVTSILLAMNSITLFCSVCVQL